MRENIKNKLLLKGEPDSGGKEKTSFDFSYCL